MRSPHARANVREVLQGLLRCVEGVEAVAVRRLSTLTEPRHGLLLLTLRALSKKKKYFLFIKQSKTGHL
jgi:hypothetical protein